jgi:hypothetical protein
MDRGAATGYAGVTIGVPLLSVTFAQLVAGLCDGSVERLGNIHGSLHELIGIAAAGV